MTNIGESRGRLSLLWWLCVSLILNGCGGSSGDAVYTGGGSAPVPGIITNGTVLVQFANVNAQTANVTGYRFVGLDRLGSPQYGPTERPPAALITLTEVPLGVTTLLIFPLDGEQTLDALAHTIDLSSGRAVVQNPLDTTARPVGLTVSPATLSSIAVSESVELTAVGRFSTGVNYDLSSEVTWTVSPQAVASISVDGTVTGERTGEATVTATLAGLTDSVDLNVEGAPSSLSLSSSVQPSVVGQNVTFSAVVSVEANLDMSGEVTFLDGETPIAKVTLSNGTATFTTSALTAGTHEISASYAGSVVLGSSRSNTLEQVVILSQGTVSLGSSANPAQIDDVVTLTAVVTAAPPSNLTPTGTVSFRQGNVILASDVPLLDGQATFSISSLNLGSYTITADYSGDGTYASSSSNLVQTVLRRELNVLLSTDVTAPVSGQNVTLAATVASQGTSRMPSGTVEFFLDQESLGSVGLVNGTATLQTTVVVGNFTASAVYSGDGSFVTASSDEVDINVAKAAVNFRDVNLINAQDNVTATVTVKMEAKMPGGGQPTGQVQVYYGATNVGTGTIGPSGLVSISVPRPTNITSSGGFSYSLHYLGDAQFKADGYGVSYAIFYDQWGPGQVFATP